MKMITKVVITLVLVSLIVYLAIGYKSETLQGCQYGWTKAPNNQCLPVFLTACDQKPQIQQTTNGGYLASPNQSVSIITHYDVSTHKLAETVTYCTNDCNYGYCSNAGILLYTKDYITSYLVYLIK